MEYQGKYGNAWYMIRNFMTGDEEQTRIEDENYTEGLSDGIREVIRLLVKEEHMGPTPVDHYDTAIAVFVRASFSAWMKWEDVMGDARQWVEMWVLEDGYSDLTDIYVSEEIERQLEELKAGFEQLMF